MARLAIKGRKARGEEVIEILEMLGGKNTTNIQGTFDNLIYTINSPYYREIEYMRYRINGYVVFTLEEFLEKLPYKVGDKVIDMNELHGTITTMSWDECNCTVLYTFKDDEVGTHRCGYTATMLKPYKKEISGAIIDRFICLEGFEFYDDKGNIINTKEIIMKKKQPKYPKTYEECFNICFGNRHHIVQVVGLDGLGDNKELFESFIKLKICRDAYWKIAGDWKPEYSNGCATKYIITVAENKIFTDVSVCFNFVLIFPTKEMRDAFYENFKELIEECKELL